jgi:hypothetical protein
MDLTEKSSAFHWHADRFFFFKMKRNADRGLLSNKVDTSVVVVFSPREAAAWPRETVYPSFCDRAMEHGQNYEKWPVRTQMTEVPYKFKTGYFP